MAVLYKVAVTDEQVEMLTVRTYPVFIYKLTHNVGDSLAWLFELLLPFISYDMMVAILISKGYSVVPPVELESHVLSEVMDEASTLESICVGRTKKRQKEVAQILDIVLKHVKSKVKDKTHHAAACVAVYKLAVLLRKVKGKEEVKASEWRRTIEAHCGVFISEGVAKYNLERPVSNIFKMAAVWAYRYISNNYPLWINKKDLPEIYQWLTIVHNFK